MNISTKFSFDVLRTTRNNILSAIDSLTFEQITKIPEGFSNSILWNVVHLYVTPHLLLYGLSNNEIKLEKTLIDNFRKGSSGKNVISKADFEVVKSNFVEAVNLFENDFEMLSKNEFTEYTTSYNITLRSVKEVALFNNSHEAMHYGTLVQLIKFV